MDRPVEKEFIEREREKPTLGDFTLGEYTEKVVVYGFLMVGSSFQGRIQERGHAWRTPPYFTETNFVFLCFCTP